MQIDAQSATIEFEAGISVPINNPVNYSRLEDVNGDGNLDIVAVVGEPGVDSQASLDRHYQFGPPPDWSERYVSTYASMHPAEDWAETFAHYLHIRDTLDTGAAFGLAPHAYLVQLRLAKARRLLAAGQPPALVAMSLGFADQSHMGRWFRRAYAMTPAYYRRRTKLPD